MRTRWNSSHSVLLVGSYFSSCFPTSSKGLVEHDTDLLAAGGAGHVLVELDADVARVAVGPHDLAPDDAGPGLLAVDDLEVLLGLVDEGDALAEVPLAALFVVDAFELDDGLVLVLLLEASSEAGEDSADVETTFSHF